MSSPVYITREHAALDEALTERRFTMARFNLDGRDALAGLDSWITREEVLPDDRDETRDFERQLYIDRETAEADLVFWQNRQVELRRQLDEASSKIGDAWLRYDQAQNEIARLSPDYEPRR